MKSIEEFKQSAIKGNVLDLAVAVIIGGAFGKIISSFVSDVLMPPIGLLLGRVDFRNLKIVLEKATATNSEVAISYGLFLQNVVDFLFIAFAVFMVVKFSNRLTKKAEREKPQEVAPPGVEEKLLTEIRDILKAR
jgi:large conductance mechanosensitive channel